MLIALKCSLLLLGMFAISGKCSKLVESHCPEAYWDGPSRDCSKHLVHHLQHGDSFNSYKINKTCLAWESTKICYQRLIHNCKSDSIAVDVVKSHLSRYYVYSSPCASRTTRELEPMATCFLKEFISTQTCSEAFDSKFRSFVLERQFSHACRIVTSIMRCFLNIMKNRISNHCGEDGSEEFKQTYIEPIVQQSRGTVANKCTLPPEVTEFYVIPDPSSTTKPHLAYLPLSAYMFLLVTH